MAAEDLIVLVDEGLGNCSYLVDLGDGRALAVDAARDLRALRAAAAGRGLTVGFAADTHLHADFLSGARQLAAEDDARVLASAAGNREFTHTGLRDGDEVDLGGLTLRALATPGHTDEHLAFLLLDGARELGVFSGGSLIVGSAARTDLLGADRAEELARAQFRSVRRLAALPAATALWPTHGAGSFCSAPPGADRTSTIGAQRGGNPLLTIADEDTFVTTLLASLGSYPAYFDRLGEANRRGPAVLPGEPSIPALGMEAVRDLLAAGALLLDVRPVEEFAAGHIPGALSNPLRPQFASWLGWVVPADAPLVVLAGPGQELAEVGWQAAKIGYDRIVGHVAGGMAAWLAAGGASAAVDLVFPHEVADRPVLDVRQDAEFAAGHLPAARHVELGELARQAPATAPGTVVMCGHGERAMTAASLLARAGGRELAVLTGGPDDWAGATGQDLETAS